jgi:hypothetical protein
LAPSSTAAPPSAEPTAVSALEPAAGARPKVAEETAAGAEAECLSDWITIDGEESLPTQCDEAAPMVDVAAVPDDQRAIEDAALKRAAEIGGLEYAPRIPQVRPEPPPVTKKANRTNRTKTALAKWPADPPPKCGSKRAKWRYVNRVPTWYCR